MFENMVNSIEKSININEEQAVTIINNIRTKLRNYVKDNNLKSVVVGISGGLDSSIIAAICNENNIGVPLIGLSIPISSSNEHREQARWIGDEFCDVFEETHFFDNKVMDFFSDLNSTNQLVEDNHNNDYNEKIRLGNLKARLRMITLYDMANKTKGMVLSTDNFSEYLSGFWTICGDVGDYAPIQKLWKGFELPIIAKYLGIRQDIIVQKPSDGLNVTSENTDEAQLGMNYKEFDSIMMCELGYIENKDIMNIYQTLKANNFNKINLALNKYKSTQFKRNGTVILERNELF